MFPGVALGLAEKLGTGVQVGKTDDSEDVHRIELFAEEIAARVADLCQLEEVCCREEVLDVILTDFDRAVVDESDQEIHRRLVNFFEGDVLLPGLGEFPCCGVYVSVCVCGWVSGCVCGWVCM